MQATPKSGPVDRTSLDEAMEFSWRAEIQERAPAESSDTEATILFALAEAMNRAESLDAVYEEGLRGVTRALDVERAAILVFDEQGVARFAAFRGLSDSYRRAVEGHSPWAHDDPDPKPIMIPDAASDTSLSSFGALFEAEGIRAIGFVPLVHQSRLFGKFMVYDGVPRRFTEREVRMAQTIAAQIAQALVRVRAYEAERRARRDAELLTERLILLQSVISGLANAGGPEEIAGLVVNRAARALGAFSAVLWLVDSGNEALELVRHYNLPKPLMAQFEMIRLDGETAMPVLDVVRTRTPVWIDSRADFAACYPRLAAMLSDRSAEISIACLPVMGEGRAIGCLAFNFSRPRCFEARERTFLAALAEACGQALERARFYRAAHEAIRAREEFISMASHDLRSPLSVVKLQLERVLRELRQAGSPNVDAAWVAERLERADRNIDQALELMNDLLEQSRMSSGELELNLVDSDLVSVVRDVIARCREQIEKAECELTLEADEPLLGLWDPLRLEQAFGNLLSNALKYGAGRPIEVAVSRAGDRALLRVRDHGSDIDAADQNAIFERFRRASAGHRRDSFGLGLWITKRIVNAMAGSISVESAPGAGAAFTIDLPVGAR